jgi:hypothetical protein
MRAAALLLALVALNGCSVNSGAAVAGVVLYGAAVGAQDPRFAPDLSDSTYAYDGFWARPVPELDPDRRISEQDCSRPLDLSLGNIRCK